MSSGERTMQKARCDFRPGYLHTFVQITFYVTIHVTKQTKFLELLHQLLLGRHNSK
jgi:hypothetical protein